MLAHGFDWDEGNRGKCQKHGVSIKEIEELFVNSPRIAPDLKHSNAEDRFIAAGRTYRNRALFVAFTMRVDANNNTLIRPVSARYMHSKEVRNYEKTSPSKK